jgi:WD40 repeat protein
VWDTSKPGVLQPSANLVGHAWAIFATDSIIQDGRLLVVTGAGIWDKRLMLWDPAQEGADDSMPPHFSEIVMGGSFDLTRRRFISAGQNGNRTLQVWDTQTHEQLDTLRCTNPDEGSLGCNPCIIADGTLLSSMNRGRTMAYAPADAAVDGSMACDKYKAVSPAENAALACTQHADAAGDVVALPGGRHVIVAGQSQVQIFDTADPKAQPVSIPGAAGRLVACCPSGRRVVIVSKRNCASVYQLQPLQVLKRLVPPDDDPHLYGVTYSPTSQHIALADHHNNITVWDAGTFELVSRFSMWDRAYRLAFTPDGQYVICGGDDKTVGLWDVYTGEQLTRMYVGAGVGQIGVGLRGHVAAGDDLGRVLFLEPRGFVQDLPFVTPTRLWEAKHQRWSARYMLTCPYSGKIFELPPPLQVYIKTLDEMPARPEGALLDEKLILDSPELGPNGVRQQMRVNPFFADMSRSLTPEELARELLALLPAQDREKRLMLCVLFDSGKETAGNYRWLEPEVREGLGRDSRAAAAALLTSLARFEFAVVPSLHLMHFPCTGYGPGRKAPQACPRDEAP